MYEIEDFTTIAPMPDEVFAEYEGQVEDFLIEFWRKYGLGSGYEGYLRTINPLEYIETLGQEGLGKVTGEQIAIPIFATAMTDLITLEPGTGVIIQRFRDEDSTGLLPIVEEFIEMLSFDGAEYFAHDKEAFNLGPYPKAVEQQGVPPYGKSFTFVPLLSLGGSRSAKSLKQNDTLQAMKLMIDTQGPLEH